MTRFVLIACILLQAMPSMASPLRSPTDVRAATDLAMQKFLSGDYAAGIDGLKRASNLSDAEFEVLLSRVKNQLPSVVQNYGRARGAEFLKQDQLGESLIRIVQLIKYENFALAWLFYYYNNGSGWTLAGLSWNDRIKELF